MPHVIARRFRPHQGAPRAACEEYDVSEGSQSEKLERINRLEKLSNADLQKVIQAGRHFTLPADWSLIWEGTAADKAYLIVDGEVSVRKSGEEIARLGPGDVIGEMGIVQQRLRSASVVSTTPLEVIHFTREGLEQLINEVPAFGEAIRGTSEDRRQG
jgi:CRP-like cAMP-binding protein